MLLFLFLIYNSFSNIFHYFYDLKKKFLHLSESNDLLQILIFINRYLEHILIAVVLVVYNSIQLKCILVYIINKL